MARKVFSISIPEELHKKMEKYKKAFNFSKICQNSISQAIRKKELFEKKIESIKRNIEKTPLEIIEKADLTTWEGAYAAGIELGFYYASKAPYTVLRPLEEYIEGWEQKDENIRNILYYQLSPESTLHSLGVITSSDSPNVTKEERKEIDSLPTDYCLIPMEAGFIDGVMQFLKKEYEPPETAILARIIHKIEA